MNVTPSIYLSWPPKRRSIFRVRIERAITRARHRAVIRDLIAGMPPIEVATKHNLSVGNVSGIKTGRIGGENTRDLRGTGLVIPPCVKRKITAEQAREIYVRAWSGKESQSVIATDYGIAAFAVHEIKYRKTWREATKDLNGGAP